MFPKNSFSFARYKILFSLIFALSTFKALLSLLKSFKVSSYFVNFLISESKNLILSSIELYSSNAPLLFSISKELSRFLEAFSISTVK